MTKVTSLDELWESTPPSQRTFEPDQLAGLPDPARRCKDEATFGGYTIPTRLHAGWHFGAKRFEADGEFFRVTIDDVRYR